MGVMLKNLVFIKMYPLQASQLWILSSKEYSVIYETVNCVILLKRTPLTPLYRGVYYEILHKRNTYFYRLSLAAHKPRRQNTL